MKPDIGVFKFSSCSGCELQFLNIENELLTVLGAVNFAYFPMASSDYSKEDGPFDIGFVDGAVTCIEEIEKIKAIREKCNILVALGSCACSGGVTSIKNCKCQSEIEKEVYTHLDCILSTKAYGIDQYVPVDAYIPGCPIDLTEMVEFVKSALLGIRPYLRPHSVCVECKLNEYECFYLKDKKEVCMGAVTRAGCGALCPSLNRACIGCRGPANDVNVKSFYETMKEYGLTEYEADLHMSRFARESDAYKKGRVE